MKLSEQLEQTCCGVLADRQEMIDKAIRLEEYVAELEEEADDWRTAYESIT
tara:strand:- start:93 stop:245 length:153 start_codon:yes stop_codon:yes gene_type:complete